MKTIFVRAHGRHRTRLLNRIVHLEDALLNNSDWRILTVNCDCTTYGRKDGAIAKIWADYGEMEFYYTPVRCASIEIRAELWPAVEAIFARHGRKAAA